MDNLAETSGPKTTKRKPRGKPFKSGAEWNGNAKGRPKGSRNKLCEDYVAALHSAWTEKGEKAIRDMLKKSPAEFVKAVGALVPREYDLGEKTTETFRDLWRELGTMNAAPKQEPQS